VPMDIASLTPIVLNCMPTNPVIAPSAMPSALHPEHRGTGL
jgi:hypothetical protein